MHFACTHVRTYTHTHIHIHTDTHTHTRMCSRIYEGTGTHLRYMLATDHHDCWMMLQVRSQHVHHLAIQALSYCMRWNVLVAWERRQEVLALRSNV